ncbi:uncharacterized protein LOC143426016 [Xylocopa sonorina]|uniref:uncharacterized protein LOC143426016 n=1 Tax=Xylocopa sonorina TaxID=1818115 RepID=UPI00403B297B
MTVPKKEPETPVLLRRARYISNLDLSQAYFQVPLEPRIRPITVFAVPVRRGIFHFTQMPFELTNAPANHSKINGPSNKIRMEAACFRVFKRCSNCNRDRGRALPLSDSRVNGLEKGGIGIKPREKCLLLSADEIFGV